MKKKRETTSHILALSGGKDSAALAVYLRDKIPGLEYVFLDTGHELPETHEYLDHIEAVLGIEIKRLPETRSSKSKRDFDFYLSLYNGCLPSPQNRWCTKQLKIIPYEKHIGQDRTVSYIALRADEDRMGYISHKPNLVPMYPFIEDGIDKTDVINILEESGLGLPGYYSWRSRSGCYFCFFQRRHEWIGLYEHHPELFEKALQYESKHLDGRTYTWIKGETLSELLERKDEVMADMGGKSNKPMGNKLFERLQQLSFSVGEKSVLKGTQVAGDLEENKPCLICTL